MLKGSDRPLWSLKKLRLCLVDDRESWVVPGRRKHGHMLRALAALNIHYRLRSALQEPAMGVCNNHGTNDKPGVHKRNRATKYIYAPHLTKKEELDREQRQNQKKQNIISMSTISTYLPATTRLTSVKQASVPDTCFMTWQGHHLENLLRGRPEEAFQMAEVAPTGKRPLLMPDARCPGTRTLFAPMGSPSRQEVSLRTVALPSPLTSSLLGFIIWERLSQEPPVLGQKGTRRGSRQCKPKHPLLSPI